MGENPTKYSKTTPKDMAAIAGHRAVKRQSRVAEAEIVVEVDILGLKFSMLLQSSGLFLHTCKPQVPARA
jgi:hypothetical protein